jgi:hypothetical protein
MTGVETERHAVFEGESLPSAIKKLLINKDSLRASGLDSLAVTDSLYTSP